MNNLFEKQVEFPTFFQDTYGLSNAKEIATLYYGYALLIIAGADGEVSQAEMNWLINHQRALNIPEYILEAYRTFDYKNGNLEELLPNINNANVPFNVGRSLVYHAIKMSKADFEFADQEQKAVKKAAQLLGVSDDILLALNGLVDVEESVNRTRKALIETSKI